MAREKQSFSVELPPQTIAIFDEFVADHGYVKWRAVNSALFAFVNMSADLREALMVGDWIGARDFLNVTNYGGPEYLRRQEILSDVVDHFESKDPINDREYMLIEGAS